MTYYTLSFITDTGKKRALRINNPVAGLPASDMEDAVSAIIDGDIFSQDKGALESNSLFELVTVTREPML